MPAEKIAITLDRDLVKEIDRNVKSGLFKNRSRAIEEAVREKLERHRRGRLLTEARKLDPKEEHALAEEGMATRRLPPDAPDRKPENAQALLGEDRPGSHALSRAPR